MKMKKVFLMFLVAILSISMFACGSPTPAETAPEDNGSEVTEAEYTIRIPHYLGEKHIIGMGLVELKKQIEEKSNGRIAVELYLNGEMGASDEENVNLVLQGNAEMGAFLNATLKQVSGVAGFDLLELPYVFNSADEVFAIAEGPFGQELNKEFIEATGARVMGYWTNGELAILSNDGLMKTPADMKGKNLRTAATSIWVETTAAMGANPTPVTYSEVYTSLQQGTIDGIVTSLSLFAQDHFYEVSKYLTINGQNFPSYVSVISEDFYQSLPADLQKALDEACQAQAEYSRNLTEQRIAEQATILTDNGVEIYELTPEERAVFKESVQPVVDKYKEIVGVELYERLLKELEAIR